MLEYSELWNDVGSGVSNMVFNPGKSGLTKLDQNAKQWQMYCLKQATIRYQTKVGTTKDGLFLMGIDYDAAEGATTKQGVYALDPRAEGPVWENKRLVVSASRAMSKKAMRCDSADPDNMAFLLSTFSDLASAGDVFVDYVVHFYSPVQGPADQPVILSSALVTNETSFGQPVGAVNVDKSEETLSTQARVDGSGKLTHETVIPEATQGQQVVVSTAGPVSQNASLVVGFKDSATGMDLVKAGYVVQSRTVSNSGNGIFSTIWTFVKPWLKPIALTAVDALLSGNDTDDGSQTNNIVVTDRVPEYIAIKDELGPLGDSVAGHCSGDPATLINTIGRAITFGADTTEPKRMWLKCINGVSLTDAIMVITLAWAKTEEGITINTGGVTGGVWIKDVQGSTNFARGCLRVDSISSGGNIVSFTAGTMPTHGYTVSAAIVGIAGSGLDTASIPAGMVEAAPGLWRFR